MDWDLFWIVLTFGSWNLSLELLLLRYGFVNFDSVSWKLVQSDFRYDLGAGVV